MWLYRFIYLPFDEPSGSFHLLATVNDAAVYAGTQMFASIPVFISLGSVSQKSYGKSA